MNRRTFLVLAGIVLTLTLIFGMLPACVGGTTTPSTSTPWWAPSPAPTNTRYNWLYMCDQLAGTPTYWLEEEFCQTVKKASGGRINITANVDGFIPSRTEIFDAVANGIFKIGSVADYYSQSKDPRFNLSGVISASFSWEQTACYYYCDSTGGKQETDALFEKFGIKRIVKNIAEPDVAVMSRDKKISEIKDFKGLNFSAKGNIPLVVQEPEFESNGLNFATADIYTSLQSKVIDAAQIGNAFSNYGSGYHEVTKYWSFPGMQRCQVSSLIINLKAWNSLPADLQEVLKLACSYTLLRSWSFTHLESAKVIPVLQKKFGIEIVRLSPDCQTTWKTVSWRLADNYAANSPEYKKMWDGMKDLMNTLAPYEELQRVTYAAETPAGGVAK